MFYFSPTRHERLGALSSSSKTEVMTRSHLCHKAIGPRIVGESEKEKDIKLDSQSKDTGKRPDSEKTQKIGFCLENSIQFSTNELHGGGVHLQGFNILCHATGFITGHGSGFMGKRWG